MTNQTVPCDDEALRLLLEGDESSEAYLLATRHVESCEACQHRLLELSANVGHWKSQQELLQPVEGDDVDSGRLSRFDAFEVDRRGRWVADEATIANLLAAPSHPEMLGRLGRYEIEKIIGSGGMGVVLKGFDTELNRPVAIKLLAPQLASVGAARQRFAREARAAAAVVHEHVVPIHNVESDNSTPFLVMQFISGESLQARLDREGPLGVVEVLRISMQAALGLAAAHSQGLVHRDVKPANILLEDGVERAFLSDFGLARAVDDASATCTGVIAGTPHYMSPEQASGGTVDARSDLFGLGCSMYAMCTARPPFRGDNSFAVLRSITDKTPQSIREINPEIPQWLCTIISRLMEKRPDSRYAGAQEVADLLERCLAHVQEPAVRKLPEELSTRKRSGTSGGKWLLALAGFGVLGLFGLGLVQTNPPDIVGDWTGQDEWGQVTIKKDDQGSWKGTFTDTTSEGPGRLALKWSRVSRRFNGTWSEGGDKAFGDLSIRMLNGEIRGAYSLDKKFLSDPEASHLAELHWIRGKVALNIAAKNDKSGAQPAPTLRRMPIGAMLAPSLPNKVTPLEELERRAEIAKTPLGGIHFAISKDRKYYATAQVTPGVTPHISVIDAATGDVLARHRVSAPLGPIGFTEAGLVTWESDGSPKLRLSFKDIEAGERMAWVLPNRQFPLEQLERQAEAAKRPLGGAEFAVAVSKDRKYYAQALVSPPVPPQIVVVDAATGNVIARRPVSVPLGTLEFTDDGVATREADGSKKLQVSFKDIESELASAAEQGESRRGQGITLEETKIRFAGMDVVKERGHFLVSGDGKHFALSQSRYPDGPFQIILYESASGKIVGIDRPETLFGPFQFTSEGLVTKEADDKVSLRISFTPGGKGSWDPGRPIPLRDVKERMVNMELLERFGHFVVSKDGKTYASVDGNYPRGPSTIVVRDAETGEKLGEAYTEKLAGPLQFTDEGVATREAEGKLILRVPLKSRRPSPGGAEGNPKDGDGPKSPSIKDGGALESRPGDSWDTMIARLRETGLDVVIVFDSTGSMDGEIGQLKRQIEKTSSALWRLIPKARIGLTTYRDTGEDYVAYGLPLTSDIGEIEKFLDKVTANGGGDLPEAVDAGMDWTLTHNSFRPGARKVMLIFGDAPPHADKTTTCLEMANEFRELHSGKVSTISCRAAFPFIAFDQIARASGGEAVATTDVKEIMTELMVAAFGGDHRERVLKALELNDSK
jgi:serine/threonine protein kinase/Mg-chelatase subunit ChlD